MKLKQTLIDLDACEDAIDWVGDRTIEEAVQECPRGDWMLWLAGKCNVDKRKLVLAKGLCANTVRHLMEDKRSIAAVDAAIAYGNGEISHSELAAAAADSADAAADAAYTAAAYAYAAYAAAAAADFAAAAAVAYADAAYAAAAYAYAAAPAYAAAAYASAEKENQRKTAEIPREVLGELIIEKINSKQK